MPVLRRPHEAQREGPVRWRCRSCGASATHANDVSAGARGLRRLAAIARDAGRDAGPRSHLQAQGRPLLADMADARGGGRGIPRRLRGRDMNHARHTFALWAKPQASYCSALKELSLNLSRFVSTSQLSSAASRIAKMSLVAGFFIACFIFLDAKEFPFYTHDSIKGDFKRGTR